MKYLGTCIITLLFALCGGQAMAAPEALLPELLPPLLADHPGQSAAYVLEKGEESLLARGWLADHAQRTIDIQYFIWSSDNIGILASEALLRAAERGVRVRVLVDDLLIDAPPEAMLALALHPNINIRIYNPTLNIGTSVPKMVGNVVIGLRTVNQRMHDKTAIFDGLAGITGGRNMADEYFDYDQAYTFRDRDILVLGPVVTEMTASFERFWESPQAVAVEKLLAKQLKKLSPQRVETVYADLHAYAGQPENFAPEVRQALAELPQQFDRLLNSLVWDADLRFLSDLPGKNTARRRFDGGGRTTAALLAEVEKAQRRITIQSPYLVMPDGVLDRLRALVRRGVQVRIVTNSLASTDNLMAFSGYRKQRAAILAAGIEVFEFRPDPAIRRQLIERYARLEKDPPTFAIHAKSLVVDGRILYVGTFNFDPRSAHLNTEVGILVDNIQLAAAVEESIERDMAPENSWRAADDPDRFAPADKRRKVWLWQLLPLDPFL